MSNGMTIGGGGSMEQYQDRGEADLPRELLGAAVARIRQDGVRVDMDGGTRKSVDFVGVWEIGGRLYAIHASQVAYNFDGVFTNIGPGSLNDTNMAVEIGWIAQDGSEGGIAHFDPRYPQMHSLSERTEDKAERAAKLERWQRLGMGTDAAGIYGNDGATTAELRQVMADLRGTDARMRTDLVDTKILWILAGGVPMGLDVPRDRHKVSNAPEGSQFYKVSLQQRLRRLAAPLLRVLQSAPTE